MRQALLSRLVKRAEFLIREAKMSPMDMVFAAHATSSLKSQSAKDLVNLLPVFCASARVIRDSAAVISCIAALDLCVAIGEDESSATTSKGTTAINILCGAAATPSKSADFVALLGSQALFSSALSREARLSIDRLLGAAADVLSGANGGAVAAQLTQKMRCTLFRKAAAVYNFAGLEAVGALRLARRFQLLSRLDEAVDNHSTFPPHMLGNLVAGLALIASTRYRHNAVDAPLPVMECEQLVNLLDTLCSTKVGVAIAYTMRDFNISTQTLMCLEQLVNDAALCAAVPRLQSASATFKSSLRAAANGRLQNLCAKIRSSGGEEEEQSSKLVMSIVSMLRIAIQLGAPFPASQIVRDGLHISINRSRRLTVANLCFLNAAIVATKAKISSPVTVAHALRLARNELLRGTAQSEASRRLPISLVALALRCRQKKSKSLQRLVADHQLGPSFLAKLEDALTVALTTDAQWYAKRLANLDDLALVVCSANMPALQSSINDAMMHGRLPPIVAAAICRNALAVRQPPVDAWSQGLFEYVTDHFGALAGNFETFAIAAACVRLANLTRIVYKRHFRRMIAVVRNEQFDVAHVRVPLLLRLSRWATRPDAIRICADALRAILQNAHDRKIVITVCFPEVACVAARALNFAASSDGSRDDLNVAAAIWRELDAALNEAAPQRISRRVLQFEVLNDAASYVTRASAAADRRSDRGATAEAVKVARSTFNTFVGLMLLQFQESAGAKQEAAVGAPLRRAIEKLISAHGDLVEPATRMRLLKQVQIPMSTTAL